MWSAKPPAEPAGVPAYPTPLSLPPASTFLPAADPSPAPGAPSGATGLVFIVSLSCLAVSDGAHWLRTDTGAAIA